MSQLEDKWQSQVQMSYLPVCQKMGGKYSQAHSDIYPESLLGDKIQKLSLVTKV